MNILKNIQYYSITYIQAYWHLLILSWLDCGPRYFLGKTRASKFKVVLYLYEQLLKIFFLMAMLNIWYTYTCKIIQIQNGINIRASGKKKTFNTGSFFSFFISIFWIWLHKADLIMSIFAQVSNVAHRPLVMNTHWKIININFFKKPIIICWSSLHFWSGLRSTLKWVCSI